jgi:hypothetical protein
MVIFYLHGATSNVLCGIMLATKEAKGLFDTKANH